MGFEPMRAKPIGFRVQLLNHSDTVSTLTNCKGIRQLNYETSKVIKLTAVGFEPTPLRTSALSWRLRPLGHAIA